MNTPAHSINIDLSDSSEARDLYRVINARFKWLSPTSSEYVFYFKIREQLIEAIELLESLEM